MWCDAVKCGECVVGSLLHASEGMTDMTVIMTLRICPGIPLSCHILVRSSHSNTLLSHSAFVIQ